MMTQSAKTDCIATNPGSIQTVKSNGQKTRTRLRCHITMTAPATRQIYNTKCTGNRTRPRDAMLEAPPNIRIKLPNSSSRVRWQAPPAARPGPPGRRCSSTKSDELILSTLRLGSVQCDCGSRGLWNKSSTSLCHGTCDPGPAYQ